MAWNTPDECRETLEQFLNLKMRFRHDPNPNFQGDYFPAFLGLMAPLPPNQQHFALTYLFSTCFAHQNNLMFRKHCDFITELHGYYWMMSEGTGIWFQESIARAILDVPSRFILSFRLPLSYESNVIVL